jgi:RND family efflux transporter MFP subunit
MRKPSLFSLLAAFGLAGLVGCGDGGPASGQRPGSPDGQTRGARSGGAEGMAGGLGREHPTAAVPVEVAVVERREISSYLETNGTLEAEDEVDLVARVTAPIVELSVEEGMEVKRGQVLARLDDRELRARAEVSRVNLNEAEQAHERAVSLRNNQLISPEEFDAAFTRLETARAQYESDRILLGYTEIIAPFDGLIVARYVNYAEHVSSGTPMFRISDFDPLLCPIQVPERDMPKLRPGQEAYLTLEAWPEERFSAKVLRIRPVVDAATGTVKVTLEVESRGRLRPGMFARVFVQTETRQDTLVIPKRALSLESIGDTVYVADGEVASRRDVKLGFQEGDLVEIVDGVSEGERIVVIGQDGLSEGTPIQVLGPVGQARAEQMAGIRMGREENSPRESGGSTGPSAAGRPDFSKMTPEELERAREIMRARGLSEDEIEKRIRRAGGDSGSRAY